MNEIIKINDLTSPNLTESYLPIKLADGGVMYAPEFWIDVPTTKQRELISLFKQYRVDYIVFEMTGVKPSVSMAVCRFSNAFNTSFPVIQKVCKRIGIDNIIVSDGGITTIDSDGELINYISMD